MTCSSDASEAAASLSLRTGVPPRFTEPRGLCSRRTTQPRGVCTDQAVEVRISQRQACLDQSTAGKARIRWGASLSEAHDLRFIWSSSDPICCCFPPEASPKSYRVCVFGRDDTLHLKLTASFYYT